LGDLPAALEASDQAAQIAEQLGDIRASLFARTKRAQVLAEIGEIEMAEAEALSCWRDANELNQKQQYLWVVWMQETLYRQQEQWAELLEMANAHKDLLGDGRLFLKVNAHLMLNRLDEIPELVASFKTWDTSGWSEPERLKYQALLGSVLFAEGQTDQAFRVLDDTLAGIEKLAAHLSGGRVLAQRGDLWLAVGRLALARADFQRAWEILDRCGAKREVESIRNKLSILGKVN
jgi:tetratricopeptide (TPR) repeat protein